MLWGGRFRQGPASDMLRLTRSIDVDIRLLEWDLAATKAHARALAAAGLLDADSVPRIDEACEALLAEHKAGSLQPDPTDEDVHSLVERELTNRLGEVGARVHTARSRNDLVANDLRMWCRDAAGGLVTRMRGLIEVLANLAEQHTASLMPGYTHLQRGQPVSLGFHLCAHGFSFLRDARRFAAARTAADVSVLGAGALAGTTLPIDPHVAQRELDLAGIFENAMDAVSDRDFACELVFACALCGVHMSRLAEEIVLWTSAEFAFARVKDEWSTGSSMMPQKRNPDMAELVRGRSARTIGELTAMLALLKGLPLAYDRDLQEDKEIVFGAVDRTAGAIEGITSLLPALTFDADAMANAAAGPGIWATDVAEALVTRGVPFRQAHAAAGRLVETLETEGVAFEEAPDELLWSASPRLRAEDRELADPRRSLAARRSYGGPAPERVTEQIRALREALTTLAG